MKVTKANILITRYKIEEAFPYMRYKCTFIFTIILLSIHVYSILGVTLLFLSHYVQYMQPPGSTGPKSFLHLSVSKGARPDNSIKEGLFIIIIL